MNLFTSYLRHLFYFIYKRFITLEKGYARLLLLRGVLAIDKKLNFRFLKEYSRRQHDGFSLKDEQKIVEIMKKRIIEIGSGMGYWGLHLKGSGREIVGIDLSKPYLVLTKMVGAYDSLIRASAVALPIRPKIFDTALAIEVIEHVDRQSGYPLIKEAKCASDCVIVLTPQNPFKIIDLKTTKFAKHIPETEKHLSKWTEEDFRREGFSTLILGESILAICIDHTKKD